MLQISLFRKIMIAVVCILGILIALPNALNEDVRAKFPSWLPSKAMNLGLDLRGGSYLLLQVDMHTYLNDQLQLVEDDVRSRLRKTEDGQRLGYVDLRRSADTVSFKIRDMAQQEQVKKALSDLTRDMEIDITQDGTANIKYRNPVIERMKHDIVEQSIEIVRRRVDETGTREPIIQRQGDDRILLQVPGLQDPGHLKDLLGKTAKMTFHLMDTDNPFPASKTRAPAGELLLEGNCGHAGFCMIKRMVALSGEMLVDSQPTYNDTGSPAVNFRFNTQGGRIFGKITKDNINKPFAIVLDGKVISAPVIQTAILGGSGVITGNFTVKEATDLALLLRAGALPAPLNILEERTVGPSLGQDSIDAGYKAAVVGAVFVMIFMVLFYGLFGFFANIGLIFNIILLIAALSLFQATLTLPGIAGIVLTMGMAVDANVLIFERIREEMRIGKSPVAAIDQGFRQAFRTIFDSNITTLIATFLLFILGTGPVKGFAVTLTVGILSSMFTAVMLTKLIIAWWVRRYRPKTIPL